MYDEIDKTLWKLFEKTGNPNYYVMYKAYREEEESEE
jgi:hypothetical protein